MEEKKNEYMYIVEDNRAFEYYCVKSRAEACLLAVKLYMQYINLEDERWDAATIKDDLEVLFGSGFIEDIVYITKSKIMNMEDIG